MNSHPEPPELQGKGNCDVYVVGGGLTGLSAALQLATRLRRDRAGSEPGGAVMSASP